MAPLAPLACAKGQRLRQRAKAAANRAQAERLRAEVMEKFLLNQNKIYEKVEGM